MHTDSTQVYVINSFVIGLPKWGWQVPRAHPALHKCLSYVLLRAADQPLSTLHVFHAFGSKHDPQLRKRHSHQCTVWDQSHGHEAYIDPSSECHTTGEREEPKSVIRGGRNVLPNVSHSSDGPDPPPPLYTLSSGRSQREYSTVVQHLMSGGSHTRTRKHPGVVGRPASWSHPESRPNTSIKDIQNSNAERG